MWGGVGPIKAELSGFKAGERVWHAATRRHARHQPTRKGSKAPSTRSEHEGSKRASGTQAGDRLSTLPGAGRSLRAKKTQKDWRPQPQLHGCRPSDVARAVPECEAQQRPPRPVAGARIGHHSTDGVAARVVGQALGHTPCPLKCATPPQRPDPPGT